ncbi:MAG: hypothetical protein H0T48_12570 [Gemmatimonadaceae bacterium]|nr:hypothetical protein [Gemmatimonadaceae bacterium]
MREVFEESERRLGATVGFADAAQRDQFIRLLADGVRAQVRAGLVAAIREVILPQLVADIASTTSTRVQERLQAMETKLNEIEAEMEKLRGDSPKSDVMDDVLKEFRAQQQDWRNT